MTHKNKIVIALLCMSYTAMSWSMQPLSDQQLGMATGQDGVTLELDFKNSTLSYNQVLITQKNVDPNKPSASLVLMPKDSNESSGVRFLKSATSNAVADQNIQIHVDSEGGINPVSNLNISLPSDANRIQISPFSLYLVSGTTPIDRSATLPTPLFSVGTHGLDLIFKEGDTLGVNIQLGNAPQGHMLKVTSGSLMCIASNNMCASSMPDDGQNPIQVHSKNGTETSSLAFGLKMTATNQTTGFRLYESGSFDGFGMDITNGGLLISGKGTSDKFDVKLSNIIFGERDKASNDPMPAPPETKIFNDLKNDSVGNLGIEGIAVKDFKMIIKGI